MRPDAIIRRAIRLFGCDEARIISPRGHHFLILGWKRRSQGEWMQIHPDGSQQAHDFDYLHEEGVASGHTMKELWKSARHYFSLLQPDQRGKPLREARA